MELTEIQHEIKSWKAFNDGVVSTIWRSPSNIALLKYWGKHEGQLAANPSLSFSLSEAHTTTKLTAYPDAINPGIKEINSNPVHPFLQKIKLYWQTVLLEIPLLKNYKIEIDTKNTFPHSAGIASSASGFSALTLAVIDIAQSISGKELPQSAFKKYASSLSRMGSGSACRSVYGGFTLWGASEKWEASADLYAIEINEQIHPDFRHLQDAILMVSAKEKSLSSTRGHALMKNHPYAYGRFIQAKTHLELFHKALTEGDIELLAQLTENEALSLHALIMSSEGGEILLEAASLELIQRIRKARQNGLSAFFSIDAGPNIHLLYPESEKLKVKTFILNDLKDFCTEDNVIFDYAGKGPQKIKILD